MFEVGDKIVHPMHGAGSIVSIEKREILGAVKDYFIVQLPVNEMSVMIPVDNATDVGMRRILSKEKMDEVIRTLKDEKTNMAKNWNRRYRENMDKIKTGDILEIADVVRNLELLDVEKTLSTGERKMLNNARHIIESEIMLVYGMSLEEAIDIVNDAIEYIDG